VTTYNALRNADLRPGDLVAVRGVGGLDHLIQYARAAGFETVAISRSPDKESLARGSQDTLEFSALRGITPETPLEDVEAAYGRMLNNEARFRAVLTP